MEKLKTGKGYKTFRTSLTVYIIQNDNQLVLQVLNITFVYQKRSIMFINSLSYVQIILGDTTKVSPLNIKRQRIVFEAIILFHCVDAV